MILCQDVRIDLYLYQVSFSWEMKITWKLVRNPLYSIYLSQIHCKDVWQFPKWIMSSGVLSAPPTHKCHRTNSLWTGSTRTTQKGQVPSRPATAQMAHCAHPGLVHSCVSPGSDQVIFHCPSSGAGIPCARQGGKNPGYTLLGDIYSCYTQYWGSWTLCLSIFLLLFSPPLTYSVLGGCVCYYEVYWNINIYF